NPLHLQRELDTALERLWKLAAPDPHRPSSVAARVPPLGPSVTLTNESTITGGEPSLMCSYGGRQAGAVEDDGPLRTRLPLHAHGRIRVTFTVRKRRRWVMRMHFALLLTALFAVSPLEAV